MNTQPTNKEYNEELVQKVRAGKLAFVSNNFDDTVQLMAYVSPETEIPSTIEIGKNYYLHPAGEWCIWHGTYNLNYRPVSDFTLSNPSTVEAGQEGRMNKQQTKDFFEAIDKMVIKPSENKSKKCDAGELKADVKDREETLQYIRDVMERNNFTQPDQMYNYWQEKHISVEKTFEKLETSEILIPFIKVARHVRNFPHPKLTMGDLRSEAVEAESNAKRILGEKIYEQFSKEAFK